MFDKEILKSAHGLNDILSSVADSTVVPENPAASGRYVLEAGTVMIWTGAAFDSKVVPDVAETALPAVIAGVLATTIEFFIGQGVTASAVTDEPVALLHHGCHFDVTQLVFYSGNIANVQAALYTCKFT